MGVAHKTIIDGKSKGEVFSSKNNTHEVKLVLLHLNSCLLAVMTHICFGALPLCMGLVPPRVRAFIGIMPGLSTIVANVGWTFLSLVSLLMGLSLTWGLRTTMGKMVHQLLK
jgi:hypothetical protein